MAEGLDQRVDALTCRARVVAACWFVRITLSREIDGNNGVATCEDWHNATPRVPTLRKTGHEDDCRTSAAFDQMKAHVCSRDHSVPKRLAVKIDGSIDVVSHC